MAGISLEQVSKVFPNGVTAVAETSLEIRDGEFLVLVGPSGSGKTTLLRMIAGLEATSSGTIRIGDMDVTNVSPENRDIAMVFQSYALYPNMTVRQNLGFGLRMRRTPKPERELRVQEIAKILGLEDLLDRRPGALSGGQRQRVAMGRAMAREPRVYLMDEPLSNLDAKLRVGMRASLAKLHDRLGVTTVYVTHDQVEATTLGQRVAVLCDARLQQCDTPQRLYDAPVNLFVASFIGSPAMNLAEAQILDGAAHFGEHVVALPPGLASGLGDRVVLGFRPTDMTLVQPGVPEDWPRLRVVAEVIEEQGSDSIVTFMVDTAPVVVSGAGGISASRDNEERLLADDRRTRMAARIGGRQPAKVNDSLEFAIDPGHLYFFDPATGNALNVTGNGGLL